jgi:anti-anti-sigma regulatory factor
VVAEVIVMGSVQVVDRGSLEIVVFLTGDIDESMRSELEDAIDEVSVHEPPRVVVDFHAATSLEPAAIGFLNALRARGQVDGYFVDLTGIGPGVRPALERAGWIHPVLLD